MTKGWAVELRSKNKVDGVTSFLIGNARWRDPKDCMGGYNTMVFRTRQLARQWVKEQYGYFKDRPDLRAEPHGWKMPRVVRVRVKIQKI